MKRKPHWRIYLYSIVGALIIGALGSMITSNGMATYDQAIKPMLTPPDWLFPIAWTILYTLMGIGFARILLTGAGNQKNAIKLYGLQLVCNFIWTVLFFGIHTYGLAFGWLLLLWIFIAMMAIAFYRIDPLAGLLQLPYLLWVGFAGYLNYMIWMLN